MCPMPHSKCRSALTAIRVMTGVVPALLLCGGIAFAALYPIERQRAPRRARGTGAPAPGGQGRLNVHAYRDSAR